VAASDRSTGASGWWRRLLWMAIYYAAGVLAVVMLAVLIRTAMRWAGLAPPA
jgi:hypothetical protein